MPAAYGSPEAAVLTKLFARLLADALNELAYPASLAGAGPTPIQSARCHMLKCCLHERHLSQSFSSSCA